VLDHGGFRISADLWAPLWASFVHAIRNALDHGLETPDERAALGKGIGTLSLRAYFSGASFVVDLGDDGRGIAWDKVRAKALAAGLPASTHADLLAALLCDGVSTKDVADELSGRGVGMAALADACTAMKGTIAIESSNGVGTTWRFEFPSDVARLPREPRSSLLPTTPPANANAGPRASDTPPGQRQAG
jgi:two-component system chemotaxis sensor kinase CheA